ncbi:MAG: chloride channel protein [Thermoflavifilum sp.]|nr:chloride channel protein [Thermoflavifilum sp.]MCL6515196.1 chloride channel protein [Alicyclobacillus sp.]
MTVQLHRGAEEGWMLLTLAASVALGGLTGILVGSASTAFLLSLSAASATVDTLPLWARMILLPLAGWANGLLLYYGYARRAADDSVVLAIHSRNGWLPLRTAWIKPVAALITLACGGAAGREGPCVHLGASLVSGAARWARFSPALRRRLVMSAAGAAFASVFGAPIAGGVYALELSRVGGIQYDALMPAMAASVTAYEVSRGLGVPYATYPVLFAAPSPWVWLQVLGLGLACGIVARVLITWLGWMRSVFEWIHRRLRLWPPLLPAFGGTLLAASLLGLPADDLGISLPLMNHALAGQPVPHLAFLWKLILVGITLGSGFYGGVATPQLVIGATAGSTFAALTHLPLPLGAAVGAMAVLASASNTPLTAIALGFELFGPSTGACAAIACAAGYLIVGYRSVYPDQRLACAKSPWLRVQPGLPISEQKPTPVVGSKYKGRITPWRTGPGSHSHSAE